MVRPHFSVIVATYNRGPHIRPTLLSALDQEFDDFELIVVGDGCTDDTLAAVDALGSERITVVALAANSGSQSVPNNAGIERSRGAYVAYLGHDDVWHPNHLGALAAAFAGGTRPDVVASGCAFHGPPGTGIVFVTGLLDEQHPAAEHFLPPSALAHTRGVIERIGGWAQPSDIVAPVDVEIVQRAVAAGVRFASTGVLTAHKFAAGHRYLSYVRPASHEQETARCGLRAFPATSNDSYLIGAAQRQGRYMTMRHDFGSVERGEIYQRNRSNKGLARPPLRALDGPALLVQTGEPRGLDWHELEVLDEAFRWSGPNPRPRILLPFTGNGAARVVLRVSSGTPADAIDALSFEQDGRGLAHAVDASQPGVVRITLDVALAPDDYSIVTVMTPRMRRPSDWPDGSDERELGIALGTIELEPLSRESRA